MAFKIANKYLAILYGNDTNLGEGVQNESAIELAAGTTRVDFECYNFNPAINSEGDTKEFLNGYKRSISNFRIVGKMKLRPIWFPETTETWEDYFVNTVTGSLLNVLNKKYHWLKFPTDYNLIPQTGFTPQTDVLAIVIGELSSERTRNTNILQIEWEMRKTNADFN